MSEEIIASRSYQQRANGTDLTITFEYASIHAFREAMNELNRINSQRNRVPIFGHCRKCGEFTGEPEFTEAGNGPFCGPCFQVFRSNLA